MRRPGDLQDPPVRHAPRWPRRCRSPEGERRVDRDLAQRGQPLLGVRVQPRHGVQQRPQIGVLRPLQQLGAGAALHHPAAIEHDDLVGDVGDHAEIVADEQDRHAELGLQVLHQLEDLRLDGDVERGGRLVGDQHRRPADQRHGDHGALAQAAGELEREEAAPPARVRGSRPGAASRRSCFAPLRRSTRWCSISASPIWSPIVCSGESELIGSWKMIEIRAAANVAALGAVLRERGEVEAAALALRVVEPDRAAGDPGVRRQDAQDRLRDHGLARAALADHRHGPVGREVERHAGHGLDLALVGGEGDAQIADRQQRLAHRPSPNNAPAAASVARG